MHKALIKRVAAIAIAVPAALSLAYVWALRWTQITAPICAVIAVLVAAPIVFHEVDKTAGRTLFAALAVSLAAFFLTIYFTHVAAL